MYQLNQRQVVPNKEDHPHDITSSPDPKTPVKSKARKIGSTQKYMVLGPSSSIPPQRVFPVRVVSTPPAPLVNELSSDEDDDTLMYDGPQPVMPGQVHLDVPYASTGIGTYDISF